MSKCLNVYDFIAFVIPLISSHRFSSKSSCHHFFVFHSEETTTSVLFIYNVSALEPSSDKLLSNEILLEINGSKYPSCSISLYFCCSFKPCFCWEEVILIVFGTLLRGSAVRQNTYQFIGVWILQEETDASTMIGCSVLST